ncbi:hypothetical protein [Rhodopila sp.]|uniref:hypothetical protein n=1 Tax=Rhodopila sp. TaxID=2480087 RepID=UPI003D13E22A
MMSRLLSRHAMLALAPCAALLGLAAAPAHARVFVGIGIPFYGPGFVPAPYYYPPPAYYPPPTYYTPPPPVVYTPPQQTYNQPPPGGQTCYAGPYVCPMERPVATGASCYCPGNNGQRVWGRAN